MRNRVIKILSNMSEIPVEKIREDSRLGGDLGLSSVQLLDLLVVLEEELHIQIDERKIPDIQTVGDVLRMIEELQC